MHAATHQGHLDAQGNTTLASFDNIRQSSDPSDGRGGMTRFALRVKTDWCTQNRSLGNYHPEFLRPRWQSQSIVDAPSHGHLSLQQQPISGLAIRSGHGALAAASAIAIPPTTMTWGQRHQQHGSEAAHDYTYEAMNRLVTANTPSVNNAGRPGDHYNVKYGYDGTAIASP